VIHPKAEVTFRNEREETTDFVLNKNAHLDAEFIITKVNNIHILKKK